MSDDFSTILDELEQIKWDVLTSEDNLPETPVTFTLVSFILKDDEQKNDFPVTELKNTSRLNVNVKNYDPTNRLDDFWRIRVNLIRFTLLQADGTPLPSPGLNSGEEIQFYVVYPTIFNNTDRNRDKFKFMAQELDCNADYVTNRDR